MLEFELYREYGGDSTRKIHVVASEVESVDEMETRPAYGGWSPIAVITMKTGKVYRVYDGSRSVARKIKEAICHDKI